MTILSGPARRTHRLLSAAASVNATIVVARKSVLKGIQGFNARGSAVYLKFYDQVASPAETDTPIKTIYLAATAAFSFNFGDGFQFTRGLTYRMTTAGADNSTAALTAADILALNIDYN